MNSITLIGNVGKDPEIRFTPANKAVVKFNVADTRGKEDNKQTIWHTVVCFEEQALSVAEHVRKGTRVIVTGRLNKASFEGRDGNKKEITELIADEVGISIRFGSKDSKPASAPAVQQQFDEEEPF
jgi:single-strand DNA-binding protein